MISVVFLLLKFLMNIMILEVHDCLAKFDLHGGLKKKAFSVKAVKLYELKVKNSD